METNTLFTNNSLIPILFSYYTYADTTFTTLQLLSKNTQKWHSAHYLTHHQKFPKKTLKLHYPKFSSLVPALKTNSRWAQFQINYQLKFPDDFKIFEEFIREFPTVEFEYLHLVISDDSLLKASELIDTMRELRMLGETCDETYKWLNVSNYCRAKNMTTKLRFETEMVFGAYPMDFIDKVEEIGLIDVRKSSRCPIEEIEVQVYSITVDGEFCTSLKDEERKIKATFSNSVRKAILEDELSNVAQNIDQHFQDLKLIFPNCDNFELFLTGEELKAEEVTEIFNHPQISRIRYEGNDEEETTRIESENITFAVGDSTSMIILKAESFDVDFLHNGYDVQGEFVIIDPKISNISVSGIRKDTQGNLYDPAADLSYESQHIIIHQSQVHHVEFKSVPTSEPKIFPNRKLTLLFDDADDFDGISSYISKIPGSIPITLNSYFDFIDDLEATKSLLNNVFEKNLVNLIFSAEIQDQDLAEYFYQLASESKTLKECTVILNKKCTKEINLIKTCLKVEQFILDVRGVSEESQVQLVEVIKEEGSNRFVMRDVHEWCIELRYQTSFERIPIA